MINDAPLTRFEPFGSALLKPIYADYSFSNIANTVHFLLTGERLGPLLPEDCFGGSYLRPEKVVMFFIDAFGWRSWQANGERFAATRRIIKDGVLTPMSALFPSTTAASVSTLNLGVLPAEHALYEWNVYIPAYGEVIQTLPFTALGSHAREVCANRGYDPAALFAITGTVHERLAAHGVKSIQFTHRNHAGSSYNKIVSKGAELVPHNTLAEGMVHLREAVSAVKGKAWLSLYWASIDSIAHQYGPGSPYHAAEIASFWSTFDAILGGQRNPNTLYIVIADHDQVHAKPQDTVYINEQIPSLADILPVSPTGNPIYPNGSPRDVFLHVRPERRDDAFGLLRERFSDIAMIMTMDEALQHGLFGPGPVCAELRRRLGDILILPHDGHFISWLEPGVMENRFHGNHGGLAPAELISAIAVTDRL